MNGPTILDGLHNSRCSKHDHWACFFIREHLNKALRYSQDSRIQNYATKGPEFFKATLYSGIMLLGSPHDLELWSKWILQVILEYVLRRPKCKNEEIIVCLSMQILAHLKLSGYNENCRIQDCADHIELQGRSYTGSSFVDCEVSL